ncbi:MAG: hypothetical protein KatS3mg027_1616 [Bacteroidia bacterium]|nr:MAG: hypothetical protein KatS3mg027_1616 [Bacteroidia bacterium]
MEKITVEATPKTPYLLLDPKAKSITIKGRSIPENSVQFYTPVFNALDTWIAEKTKDKITVSIQLEYFNTSSSKCILDIFKKLQELLKNGAQVDITWIYEKDDEDMMEAGQDYQTIVGIPFKMVEVEE